MKNRVKSKIIQSLHYIVIVSGLGLAALIKGGVVQ